MHFVMSQAVCAEGMKLLEGISSIKVLNARDLSSCKNELQNADAAIVRIAFMNAEAISAATSLKVIGRTGVGFDNVDVFAATERGIPVVITPGANNHSVAEHALALMFALAKNLVEAHNEQMAGNYEIRGKGTMFELFGKTVTVVGLGAIGRDLAGMCKALGMRVLGFDPFLTDEAIRAIGAEPCKDLLAVLPDTDILSLHVPLTKETINLIDETELALMKPTAVIINCARGGILNESALAEALNANRLAGAGIDVFAEDPPQLDNVLLRAKNVIVSPHSAAQTREAVIRMATMCIEGCLAVLRGEKWSLVANPEVYNHPRWKL